MRQVTQQVTKDIKVIILPQKKRLKAKEGENPFHFLVRQGYAKPSACRILVHNEARAPTEAELTGFPLDSPQSSFGTQSVPLLWLRF